MKTQKDGANIASSFCVIIIGDSLLDLRN